MLGAAMGARVIAVDVAPERLALAKEFGADEVIDPRGTDPVKAIRDLTHGEGADADDRLHGPAPTRGAPAVRCARHVGPRRASWARAAPSRFDPSRDMLRRQLTLHASWTFSSVGQGECARFVADRKIPLQRLLTHHFSLDQAAAAYRLFDTQTTGKGVFLF